MEYNYAAIIAGTVINILIALVWYNKHVFGSIWMKAAGTENMDMEAEKKAMPRKMISVLITSFILVSVLSFFVQVFDATTFTEGMVVAFWGWLGFGIYQEFGRTLWENAPIQLFYVNAGYMLVSYTIIGGMLAVWR